MSQRGTAQQWCLSLFSALLDDYQPCHGQDSHGRHLPNCVLRKVLSLLGGFCGPRHKLAHAVQVLVARFSVLDLIRSGMLR